MDIRAEWAARSDEKARVLLRGGALGKRARHFLWNITWYVILSFFAVVLAMPLVWLVSTSLKAGPQTFVMPPQWIPDPVVWQNYPNAFRAVPFHRYFWNTIQIVIFATMGTLITASMAAFAFARLRFPARGFLFSLVLATMMLPGIVTLIPTFIVFRHLGSAFDRALVVWRRRLQHFPDPAVLHDVAL